MSLNHVDWYSNTRSTADNLCLICRMRRVAPTPHCVVVRIHCLTLNEYSKMLAKIIIIPLLLLKVMDQE